MSARLLLVDDEPGVREAVKDYLEESNFTVQVASNADDAWQLLQDNMPDLLISDIMMPQVSGIQFLKQLREDPRFESLPVVLLTAKGMSCDRIEGYQAGCDAYLPKPFNPDELVAIVLNLLLRRASISKNNSGSNYNIDDLIRQIKRLEEIADKICVYPKSPAPIKPAPINIDLTPREQSILELVAAGLMNKEIARRLNTSIRNVEKYVSRLFDKTGTNSRTELVRYALEHGLAS
ncbi:MULTISPECIES: response regulator transcription factor [Calothrix]|uniref:Response regulator transcription factor n=2 Tax=Calothrix TaxID=1186 RepID=A0ABR8A568_9CYAN|nr:MULTISPECIES: response regulator transcription factor [Calothrix]MBD2195102.1 response regulator transcription factor [Calothrix parietina FACHB-288]MBD2223700.1 response regulator transcription factor [Calothrix anomala FACHB-343]